MPIRWTGIGHRHLDNKSNASAETYLLRSIRPIRALASLLKGGPPVSKMDSIIPKAQMSPREA